ncbi:MAG: FGGY-family carbohydrate kinase [Actinomycetota bacterium]|nr:FGGY-family carbohydrate kinase [Actinomycetota bacterium]
MSKKVIAIDIGSSSIRASVVNETLEIERQFILPFSRVSPIANFVEYNHDEFQLNLLSATNAALEFAGDCEVEIAITNQRATTAAIDSDGKGFGPILSWMDLRTSPLCLDLSSKDHHIAPNQAVTKAMYLASLEAKMAEQLRFATLDTLAIFHLTNGQIFATDHSNAATAGFIESLDLSYSKDLLRDCDLNIEQLPQLRNTYGTFGFYDFRGRDIEITVAIGDQQASLLGQNAIERGSTKVTFGTGTILDTSMGLDKPKSAHKSDNGTFPIVTYTNDNEVGWGFEALSLGSGSCVDWLISLGVISGYHEASTFARNFRDYSKAIFVPAPSGLGTPIWDFGARSLFEDLTLGDTKTEIVAAVLDGIAALTNDLLDAAIAESGVVPETIYVDGGMVTNRSFVEVVADNLGLKVAISPEKEATTIGASALALAKGDPSRFADLFEQIESRREIVAPLHERGSNEYNRRREAWLEARSKAQGSIPELSAISF